MYYGSRVDDGTPTYDLRAVDEGGVDQLVSVLVAVGNAGTPDDFVLADHKGDAGSANSVMIYPAEAGLSLVSPANGGKERRQVQRRQQRPRRHLGLVGADRHPPPGGGKTAQRLVHARIGLGLVRRVGAVIHQEIRQRPVINHRPARREGTLHQRPGTIAHHPRHLRPRERRQPPAGHQPVHRRREIGHRIHQRAVEIKDHQGLHSGGSLLAGKCDAMPLPLTRRWPSRYSTRQ